MGVIDRSKAGEGEGWWAVGGQLETHLVIL